MEEKVLEILREQGFQLECLDEKAYKFAFEGRSYLYMPEKKDEEFLSISLPNVYELDDGNYSKLMLLADRLNTNLKYVKVYRIDDALWLFYEREVLDGEALDAIVPRMIMRLDAAYRRVPMDLAELEAEIGGINDEGDPENFMEITGDEDEE